MITVHDLRLMNQAVPTLWTGRMGEHGSVAIHFRWGGLTVRLSRASGDPYGPDGEVIFESPIEEDENRPGREGDSCIGETEMKETLKDVLLSLARHEIQRTLRRKSHYVDPQKGLPFGRLTAAATM